MGCQYFLHPDHVVPLVQFITGIVKVSNCAIADSFVKGDAGRSGVSDAGTEIADILQPQLLFQFLIKGTTDSLTTAAFFYINRCFYGLAIGIPNFKC